MKKCSQCGREYDLSMSFCLDDGAELLYGPASIDEPATAILSTTAAVDEAPTRARIYENDETAVFPSASGEALKSRKFDVRLLLAALTLVVIVLGGFFGYRYFNAVSTNEAISSIAVLPFENRSGNADSEYLSDGLAEALIYRLSQIPDLKVSPTSSVFRYKGKETDPKVIARELAVDSVLTGRITQLRDTLTISVNLVDTRNGKSLWGEQYDRKMSDLLQTQREITTEIANNLKLKLSGESQQKLAKKYTDNNEAYQLYLQGRFHWSKRTGEDYRKAVEAYRRAIALDQNFALAYVGIADVYNSMGKDPVLAPKDSVPLAKEAATQALKIDPTLAEAHSALADSSAIYDWDWPLAEREFRRARELDPNVGYIHLAGASSYFAPLKRTEEMLAEMNRALELEPLSLINNAVLVTGLLYARQNGKALQQARRAQELDPNFRITFHWLGLALTANGMYDEAVKVGEGGLQKWPDNPEMLFIAGYAYAASGRRSDAERYIARIRDVGNVQYVRTYWLACIYAALGDKDKAFAELERSYEDRDCFLPRANIDPAMDPLRNDARFEDLMRRMNLPK